MTTGIGATGATGLQPIVYGGTNWLTLGITTTVANDVACSYTGQYVVISSYPAGTYVSNDSGNSWTQTSISRGYYACSQSGLYMYCSCTDGHVYLSSDYGVDWDPVSNGATGGSYPAITCSSDGSIMAYVNNVNHTQLEVLSNYGATGTSNTVPIQVNLLAGSANCQDLVVSGPSGLYVSNSSGSTWTLGLTGSYAGVSMSSNGQIILAVTTGPSYVVHISYNGGATWAIATTSTHSIEFASMSADGRVMVISGNDVLISTDFGHTWTSQFPYLPIGFNGQYGVVSGDGLISYIPEVSVSHLCYGFYGTVLGSTGRSRRNR